MSGDLTGAKRLEDVRSMEALGTVPSLRHMPLPILTAVRGRRDNRSIGVEHMLLEALDITRHGQPRHCARSEDVRARNQPSGFVKGSSVQNLNGRESFQREAYAVA